MRTTLPLLSIALYAILVAACGGPKASTPDGSNQEGEATATPTSAPDQEPSDGGSGASLTVAITGFSFPALSVTTGSTVTWVNEHSAPHTVTSGSPGSPDGTWESGTLNTSGEFSFDFSAAGTYEYFCSIHPDMRGTVTVAVLRRLQATRHQARTPTTWATEGILEYAMETPWR
jgi:plastocyanin